MESQSPSISIEKRFDEEQGEWRWLVYIDGRLDSICDSFLAACAKRQDLLRDRERQSEENQERSYIEAAPTPRFRP